MTPQAKSLLLGTALLAFSGYSAAGTPDGQSTAGCDSDVTASDVTGSDVIVTGTHWTDREIRAEAMRRIGEKPALRTENIDVQGFDHNVYLYSVVTSRMDSQLAEAIVRTVPGVRNVYNGLGSYRG